MNIRKLRKILLLFLAMLLIVNIRAAVPFEKDTALPVMKKFDKAAVNTYKKDRDFRYRNEAPEENGLVSLIYYFLDKLFGRVLSTHVGSTSVYSLILYTLMIFGAVMLILQFLKVSPQSLLSRSSPAISVDSSDGDNIHEIDFDKLILQSANQQDYRLAVRFWYLKMLKILSDAQLINWQISKTNYDYYYELKQQALRNEFLSLTNTFENSWYGNHNLSTERYNEAMKSFTSFFTTLNQNGR